MAPAGAGAQARCSRARCSPAQVSAPRPERQNPAPLPWCFRSPVSLVVHPALLFSECVSLVPLPWCFRSAVSLVPLFWCFRSACLWFPLPWCFRSPVSWSVFPVKKLKKIGAASTRWATADGCPRRARQGRGAVGNPRTRRAVHRLALWAGGLSTAGAVA